MSRYQLIEYRLSRKLFDLLKGSSVPSAPSALAITTPMKRKDVLASAAAAASAAINSPSPILTAATMTPAQLDIGLVRIPLRLHTSYQIIDLGSDIVALVSGSLCTTECTETGWFKPSDIQRVRTAMNARVIGWCEERGVHLAPSEFTALLAPELKKKHRTRRTLGRAFAAERNKARGMMTVRKPRSYKKKSQTEKEASATGSARKKRKTDQAETDAAKETGSAISRDALRAATAVASAAVKQKRGGRSEEDDDDEDEEYEEDANFDEEEYDDDDGEED